MKRKLTPREIAAIRRRRFMMYADNGGERPTPPEPEPTDWNMRVVAHPEDGYEMPTTTGNFTLVEQDGDEYFYQHDGSSSTGNNVLYVSGKTPYFGITDVEFSGCEHITSIGDKFLYWCKMLETINLSEFSNVEEVGKEFLRECHSLLQIDLSPLSKTTTIGYSFLSACHALTTIDLSPLSGASIDTDYFLYGCSNLVSIDLTPLADTTRIGVCFLRDCNNLTSVDLSPLERASTIGISFLYSCYGLNSLKLPWTTIPTTATDGFMTNVPTTCTIEVPCEALSTYKTTSPWSSRADYINGGEGCEEPEPSWNMKVVANPDEGYEMPTTTGDFTLVKQDGNEYFYHHDGSDSTGNNVLYESNVSSYWGMTDVTFKDCEHITSIGNYFLAYCGNMTEINISALNNVTRIGNAFLAYCTNITEINLSVLSNTTSVGSTFLGYCSKLTEINLSALSNTTSVGGSFLAGCVALTSLDISLPNTTTIGSYFLSGCEALTSLDLSLPNVTNISDYFVRNCSNLTSLNLSKMGNVTSIGRNFLYGSTKLNSLNVPWTTIPTTSATAKLYFMLNVPTTCNIEVPCESVDTYKTTSPWKNRADYIVGDC